VLWAGFALRVAAECPSCVCCPRDAALPCGVRDERLQEAGSALVALVWSVLLASAPQFPLVAVFCLVMSWVT